MAELPSARTRIDEQAGAVASGVNLICVLAAVDRNADAKPRLFSNHSALLEQHDYNEGAEYAALHIEETGYPVLFVGLPIVTEGAISAVVTTGNSGTSVATVTAPDGVRAETRGVVKVRNGGTIGTDQIGLDVSLDGGRTYKFVRLGTANTYLIPYVGLQLAFAAGTLVAGDTAITFSTSAPRWDQAGLLAARTALVAQKLATRTWLVIGDVATEDDAQDVVDQVNAYAVDNDRFTFARVQARDRGDAETITAWRTDVTDEFADIDGEPRISIGIGRARKMSPITGYRFRRPAQWAVSIREYQHDVHIAPYAKALGELDGWDLEDSEGTLVEFDERIDGGALAANFTCLRTWGNGPAGAFVALSLTRAAEGSLLSRTHNMAVANVACSVVQAETEMAIGRVLELDDAGRATLESLATIEERVNTSLDMALMQDAKGEGRRASKAVWRANKTDVLNVPGARLRGVLGLQLGGTLEHIDTAVRIQTAG